MTSMSRGERRQRHIGRRTSVDKSWKAGVLTTRSKFDKHALRRPARHTHLLDAIAREI